MKGRKLLIGILCSVYLVNCIPLVTYAAVTTASSSPSTSGTTTTTVTTTDEKSNAEQALENKDQVKAELANSEQAVLDGFSTTQKEAYMILANKYMTQTELQAMEWNLVLSQFAVPYKENIQDVWNHESFKEMRENELVIEDNPYLKTITENMGSYDLSVIKDLIDFDGSGSTESQTNMQAIADCMLEDNLVNYSMVYNGDSYAYVSDLFDDNTNYLSIKDKVTVTGDAASKTDLWSALESMQENYLIESKTKEELATDVMSGSTTYDIQLPVWINCDSTVMYNAIYVANAIRIGGYGTYENFINNVQNSQLYMDRWGNLCAYCKVDGTPKYVIVYPAYSNPIFNSTEIDDDDYAGYAYDNFDNSKQLTSSGTEKNANIWHTISGTVNGYLSDSNSYISQGYNDLKSGKSTFTIESSTVLKTYSQIKKGYITDDIDSLDKNAFLGDVNSTTKVMQQELAKSPITGKNLGSVYSRIRSAYRQKTGLIPIMGCDTTTNMVFNKAVLSAYTRDSYNSYKDSGSTAKSLGNGWYNCMSDSTTTYSTFALSSQYNKNNKEALFSNSIVFDKYYTSMVVSGSNNNSYSQGPYAISTNGSKYYLQESTLAAVVQGWTKSNGYYKPADISKTSSAFTLNYSYQGLRIKDTTKANDYSITMYPFMQMHTFRKGLYSDTPTLQSNKTKGFGLNSILSDYYVTPTWNVENTVATSKDNYLTSKTTDKTPIELIWDAMELDSDKFKTYVVFNYTSDVVPSNSVIYGFGHRLTKNNQGTLYFEGSYLKDSLKETGESVGRVYLSIPLFDYTFDTACDWSIWETIGNTNLVNSKQSGARSRTTDSMYRSRGDSFFEPSQVTGTNSANALRYYLNDQRVSDVLENYPLEDVVLLSFVWRNYYTPQTPFRTKLNNIQIDENNTEKPYKLKADSSVSFSIDEDAYCGNEVSLTPGNVIASDSSKVNNTLIWTKSCSRSQESQLSPGSGTSAAFGIGQIDSLSVEQTYVYRVSYNFGMLLLAVNKNTQGDNLTNLVEGYDASKEFNTEDIMSNISYFFEHPVLSLTNIFLGFVQMIHTNVAVGGVGNVFDISWVIDLAVAKGIIKTYIWVSSAICCVMLIIRGLAYMITKKQTLASLLREWGAAICLSTVPVIILYALSDGLQVMSLAMTRSIAGNLAAVEIEKEVTSSENLNINFETVYTAYKEQFEGIEDDYEKLSLKVPTKWNATLNSMEYKTVTIRELYDSVEYSNVLSAANLEATMLEAKNGTTSISDLNTCKEVYEDQQPGINCMYYSYSEFVPVNYDKYSENIFYYFYDYIKYQYLAYWASQTDGGSSSFSAAAQRFTFPEVETVESGSNKGSIKSIELWSTYIGRMWDAERYMLQKSYNGMYIMYHDKSYTYNKLYNDNGKEAYSGAYPTDMFGLSYLFNMDNLEYDSDGYTGVPSSAYLKYLTNIDNNFSKDTQMTSWKQTVQEEFLNTISLGTLNDKNEHNDDAGYAGYISNISKQQRRHKTNMLKGFYPLAYLMDNPIWDSIKVTNKNVCLDPGSDDYADYCFTPTYLENELGDTAYADYPKLSEMKSIDDIKYKSDSLSYTSIGNNRLPWRVYASKSALFNSTYDGKKVDTDTVPFEELLMKCNENIFEKVKETTEYLQGDIRDSSLIFTAALVATMEFNKTFSPVFFYSDNQLQPQTFTNDSMDMDKFMRVTFARDMDDIVKNTNVMYMIYEQDGGIITAIIVALSEIMFAVTMLARVGVMIMMLLSCAYVCFCYFMHKFKQQQSMVLGIVTQLLQIIVSQFVTLLVLTQSMKWVAATNATLARLLLAVLMLICSIAIARWSLYMLFAIIKDMKNFGGAIIQGSVNSALARLNVAFADIKNNNQMFGSRVNINNAGVSETSTGDYTENRRSRNVNRMDKAYKNRSSSGTYDYYDDYDMESVNDTRRRRLAEEYSRNPERFRENMLNTRKKYGTIRIRRRDIQTLSTDYQNNQYNYKKDPKYSAMKQELDQVQKQKSAIQNKYRDLLAQSETARQRSYESYRKYNESTNATDRERFKADSITQSKLSEKYNADSIQYLDKMNSLNRKSAELQKEMRNMRKAGK